MLFKCLGKYPIHLWNCTPDKVFSSFFTKEVVSFNVKRLLYSKRTVPLNINVQWHIKPLVLMYIPSCIWGLSIWKHIFLVLFPSRSLSQHNWEGGSWTASILMLAHQPFTWVMLRQQCLFCSWKRRVCGDAIAIFSNLMEACRPPDSSWRCILIGWGVNRHSTNREQKKCSPWK